MALRTDVQVHVNGRYLKGYISGQYYMSDSLIKNKSIGRSVSKDELKKIIQELQELADTMDGVAVADALTEDNNSDDDEDLAGFLNDDDWSSI